MSNQTILIIDDEIQIRKVLKITLEANNYNVIEAENGNDGITKTAMHKPNAIFLDLGLPDQDGMKVLKNIREWYNSPIIILSVRNSEKDIIEAYDIEDLRLKELEELRSKRLKNENLTYIV